MFLQLDKKIQNNTLLLENDLNILLTFFIFSSDQFTIIRFYYLSEHYLSQ